MLFHINDRESFEKKDRYSLKIEWQLQAYQLYPSGENRWQTISKSGQPGRQSAQQLALLKIGFNAPRLGVIEATDQNYCDYLGVLSHDD